jgi:phosphatidylglycerophosphate synthase
MTISRMTESKPEFARTAEIEEVTNRWFIHPSSRFFVRFFERLGIHPNVVSMTGMTLGALAGWAYYYNADWRMSLLGFALMVGWHVMDGADGQLARLTGKTSEIGKVLDGLCDHTAFLAVYVGLGVAIGRESGSWIWLLAVPAGVAHVMQASAYEFQRSVYDYAVRGKASARVATVEEFRAQMQALSGLALTFAKLHLLYLKVQSKVSVQDDEMRSRLDTALAGARELELRQRIRELLLPSVKQWSLLCSNYRTIAIFAACLIGWPALFFWYELVVLNVALFWLMARQRRINDTIAGMLGDPAAESASQLAAESPVISGS